MYGQDEVKKVIDKVGILERRVCTHTSPAGRKEVRTTGIQMSYYCSVAVLEHLKSEGYALSDVDLLLHVSESGDYLIPANACVLHGMLGLSERCWAFDISMGCSGYPYALATVKGLMEANEDIKTALIVSSDAITRFLDPQYRGLNCIHGDGAAVTLVQNLEYPHSSLEVCSLGCGSQGSNAKELYLRNDQSPSYVHMNGPAIAHFASRKVPDIIRNTLREFGLDLKGLDLLLLHQANQELITAIYKRLGADLGQQFRFIEKVGNLSNASTPVLLAEALRSGRIEPGHTVMTVSFGAGLSWGCSLLRASKDGTVPVVIAPTEMTELEAIFGEVPWTI
jgi:3-oxoacyl-[acyl-carrier-protein] synthase-3